MKKRKYLISLFLLGCMASITSQNIRTYEVFNMRKLDALLKLNESQKQKINLVFEKRKKDFLTTEDWYERRDINGVCFTEILVELSKEQTNLLISQFLPKQSNNKPYYSLIDKFPKSYQPVLINKLKELEDKEGYLAARYVFDPYTMQEKAAPLIQERYKILKEEQIPLNKAIEVSMKKSNCLNTESSLISLLKEYEFYVQLDQFEAGDRDHLENIVSSEGFLILEEQLSRCVAENSLKYLGNYYVGQDSITQTIVFENIYTSFLLDYQKAANDNKSMDITMFSFKPFVVAKEVLENRKSELLALSKKNEEQRFFKNAEKIGIPYEKAKKVFDLISQRDAEIKAYQKFQMKKATEYSLSVIGDSQVKTPYQVRLGYAKDLAGILTLKEYETLLLHNFNKSASSKTKEQIINFLGDQNLEEQQKNKLTRLVYDYNLERDVTKSYYSYDRTLQQQKLGAVTYRFE